MVDTNISARFYRVDKTHKKQALFAASLGKIQAIAADHDRDLVIGETRVGSTGLNFSKPLYWGDLLRLQDKNLPSLRLKGQPPRPLKLPPDGHLGHHTAFLYDAQTRMLAFQTAHSTVSLSNFNLYIDSLSKSGLYDFVPVLKPDELKQLAQMQPKTFLIKIADPEDLEAVEAGQVELQRSLVALQGTLNGAYVKIQVGMGHYKHNLERGKVSSVVSWLLEQYAKKRGDVKAIQLKVNPSKGLLLILLILSKLMWVLQVS